MPQERRLGLRVSACLTEDVWTSIKKLNTQKCEIPLEPAWEQQPCGQGSWPGAWHHRQTKVGFSQPGSLTFTGTYICLPHFSQKGKKNVLLHPEQKRRLLSSAEVSQAMEDYQGVESHGVPLSPPAPSRGPASFDMLASSSDCGLFISVLFLLAIRCFFSAARSNPASSLGRQGSNPLKGKGENKHHHHN